MAESIRLPEWVQRGTQMHTGKGWRLVGNDKRGFKASLVKTFKAGPDRVTIFRIREKK